MKRIISLLLAVCMVFTLPSLSVLAAAANTLSGANGEITAFAELSETEKSVPLGTSLEDLKLPATLTATVRAVTNSGSTEETVKNSGSGQQETTVSVAVTWVSSPEYDTGTAGIYVFTPEIEGYTVSASLPEITVTEGNVPNMLMMVNTAHSFDISNGSVTVSDSDTAGKIKVVQGNSTTDGIDPTEEFTIKGTSTANKSVVIDASRGAKIILDNINITVPDGSNQVAMEITEKANNVTLMLNGQNNLNVKNSKGSMGDSCAALRKSGAGKLTIESIDGTAANSLTAMGNYYCDAGIGNYWNGGDVKNITINSGTVTAGGYGASIGVYKGSTSGITINGGIVTLGSTLGSAVCTGSLSDVTFNGGTVSAKDIGAQTTGNILFKGGNLNVAAIKDQSGNIIPTDGNGHNVYKATFTVPNDITGGKDVRSMTFTSAGKAYTYPMTDAKSILDSGTGKVYVYLPAGAAELTYGGKTYTATVNANNTAVFTEKPIIDTWAKLTAAVGAAPAGDTTIEIGASFNADGNYIYITSGKNITIQSADGGPYTITRASSNTTNNLFIVSGGALTLKHITLDGNNVNTTNCNLIYVFSSAELVLDSGAVIQNVTGNAGSGQSGCINIDGKLTMMGGSVIQSVKSDDNAVNLSSDSTMTISGNVKVTGNTKLDGTTPANVSLSSGATITIGAGGLDTKNARIGVSTGNVPTAGSPVNITGSNSADYSGSFTSDDSNYAIKNGASNVVQVAFKSQETPNITIDYATEQLNGFASNAQYTINSAAQTPTGTSIDIDSGWFGTTLSIVKNGDSNTDDSAAQSLTVPAIPTAPAATGVNPTTIGGAGKITNVTTAMQYKSTDGDWQDVTGTELTNLAAGTYQIRTKATSSAFASAAQTITITAFTGTQETTPAATFTAAGTDAGTLTNIVSGMQYSVNGGSSWITVTGTNADITGVSTANGVKVKKPGNGTTTTDSEIQSIPVTKGGAVTGVSASDCTTFHNNDGKLKGVTTAMEYKLSSASAWTLGTGSDITGLANGAYDVRVKANGTMLTGDSGTFTVGAFVPTSAAAPTILPNLSTAENLVNAGDSVTLSLSSSVSDGGTLSYQWYSNSINSAMGSVAIIGATGTSYIAAASTSPNHTDYYYCVVTNTNGTYKNTATSNIAPVRTKNNVATIESFGFASPTANGTVDSALNTVSVTVPYGTNVTALTPAITLTDTKASVSPAGAQNFTNSVTYTVTAEDGTAKPYTVTVNVAPDPDIAIVAAAKAALTDGTVDVAFGATQDDKTAAVQSYVNDILSKATSAAGVIAVVTYNSGTGKYDVALSKGNVHDTKSLNMTVNVAPDPDIAIVEAAKTAAESTAYSSMTQAAVTSDSVIETALKVTAQTAVNNSDITVSVNKISYTAPVAGTSANPSGTNGSYLFTITVSKGARVLTTIQKTIIITATAYTGGNSDKSSSSSSTQSTTKAGTQTKVDKANNDATVTTVPDSVTTTGYTTNIDTSVPSVTLDNTLTSTNGDTVDTTKKTAVTINVPTEDIKQQLSAKQNVELTVTVPSEVAKDTNANLAVTIAANKGILEAAKENLSDVTIKIKDADTQQMAYSWTFKGADLAKSTVPVTDVNIAMSVHLTTEVPKVNVITPANKGLVLSFDHSGVLPSVASVKISALEKGFKPGETLYFYYYNPTTKQIESLGTDAYAVDADGYVTVQIYHCSDYVLLPNAARSITLYTKIYTMAPNQSYEIGAKLANAKNTTLKVYSSAKGVASITKLKNGNYKVTALKTGLTYIMFDVYDEKSKLIAKSHASVKLIVKSGVKPIGNSRRQVAIF